MWCTATRGLFVAAEIFFAALEPTLRHPPIPMQEEHLRVSQANGRWLTHLDPGYKQSHLRPLCLTPLPLELFL